MSSGSTRRGPAFAWLLAVAVAATVVAAWFAAQIKTDTGHEARTPSDASAIREAIARNAAVSRARGQARQTPPDAAAPVVPPTYPQRGKPSPPDGHAFTRVANIVLDTLPRRSQARPTPRPLWLDPVNARDPLLHHAVRAGRDWMFAMVLVAPGVPTDALRDALQPLGGAVLGAAGAYVRTRVPTSEDRLDRIAALPEVAGIGIVPTALKIDPGFLAAARQRPPQDVAPVFVTLMSTDADGRWRRQLEALGAVVGARDNDLRAWAANVPFGSLHRIVAADFVLAVEPVGLVNAAHDTAIPVMGADASRTIETDGSFTGITGATVPVGIIDTGLNVSHPDIATGRASVCGENYVPFEDYDLWRDLGGHSRSRGHGTHVAGTILGAGTENPLLAGIAPGVAHVRVAKVLPTRSGPGTTDNINRAMDYLTTPSACTWAGAPTPEATPLLVNMSLAATGLQFSGRGVGERKLDATVWGHRQLYVVAQANAGLHGLSNYATAKTSLAVGAVADTGSPASFSSLGPTADGRLAPNVVATGIDVWSVRGQGRRSGYDNLNGTSMAAPAVSGIAALLMDAEPRFKEQPALTRARIMASAVRPMAFLGEQFRLDNTNGPGELQNQYGLGIASARLTVLQRADPDGWTSGAASSELADGRYAFVDIDVPAGASRLEVVMTWDEGPADAVTESVLNDLDLWIDVGADCGPGACGERSSRSRTDNVEWVLLEQPAPGTHRVKVVAERVHGAAPRAAVAWTVIRGPSIPRLRVEPSHAVIQATAGHPVEVELTVTVDGHVATGTTLHLGSRGSNFPYDAGVEREDGTTRDAAGSFQDPIALGEIGSGEVQRLTLTHTPDRSHRLYLTASAWNATAGSAHVDVVVDGNDDLGTPLAPPGIDDFAAAATIAGTAGEHHFELMLASRQPGEPGIEQGFLTERYRDEARAALESAAARSVWFSWRAPRDGTYYFSVGLPHAPRDRPHRLTMSVFQGDAIASLQRVGANDTGAIAFNAKHDETYRVRVATTHPSPVPYLLTWDGGHAPPSNDDFAHAQTLVGAEGEVSGTNQGAGLEPNEFFGDLAATVWYEWTAPDDGQWTFRARGLSVLAFVGDAPGDLRLVSTQSRSAATFPATVGRTYRIAVAVSGTETAGGPFDLVWEASEETLAENDAFSDATAILGPRGGFAGILLWDATVESDEPYETGTQTRWWRWEAPGRGPYTLRLTGGDAPVTILNAFAGDSLDSLRWLDGGREVVIATEPGESYAVSVGKRPEASFQATRGDVTLTWGETPANDVPASAVSLVGSSGAVTASNAFATTSFDEPAAIAGHTSLWWWWTAPDSRWYRFRVARDEIQGIYGQPVLAVYRMSAGGEPAFVRSTDRSYVLSGDLETAVGGVSGARYLIQVASRGGSPPGPIEFDWAPTDPPAWLRYRGRVLHGDRLPSGSTVTLAEARSLALDDGGNRLFANGKHGLAVMRVDERVGSISPSQTVAYRDASGKAIDWIAGSRLHWDGDRRRLYAFSEAGDAALFRWDDDQGLAESCMVSGQPSSNSYPQRIIGEGGFVYVLRHGDLLVYRVDADCAFTVTQVLTGKSSDEAGESILGLAGARDAVIGADGDYVHVAADGVLLTFARDADTGALSLASSINEASSLEDGRPVQFPEILTSAFTDASRSLLYLIGSIAPDVAVFDIRADPANPVFLAVLRDFHIRFPNFRTHLFWPPDALFCHAPSSPGTATAAVCKTGVHLLEWNPATAKLRVPDFAGSTVADRFGGDLPQFGSPGDVVQSPDGTRLFAIALADEDASTSILAFQTGSHAAAGVPIEIPDPNLEATLREALGKSADEPVTDVELAGLKRLDAPRRGIMTLAGLEAAYGLVELVLWGNEVSDVSPLAGLSTLERLDLAANRLADLEPLAEFHRLKWLNLAGNEIDDISAIAGLPRLTYLGLHGNRIRDLPSLGLPNLAELSLWGNEIADVSALADLTTLNRLNLAGNRVSDVEPLAHLEALTWLNLSDNTVEDVSALTGLTGLHMLRLAGNRIVDVTGLTTNAGLRDGTVVDLRGNALENAALDALVQRGTTVLRGDYATPAAPMFPAADHPTLQGFVRLVNRSPGAGEVRVLATDDSGREADAVWLSIGPLEAVHFNSDDLESGNLRKRLSGRTGAGQGDWQLAFASGLDIEALSYLRARDGFLTAIHDEAPRDRIPRRLPIFNPGSNIDQQSRLRLVNADDTSVPVAIRGVDDTGRRGSSDVHLTVEARSSVTLTAVQLESGGGILEGALGDGQGKWRLEVEGERLTHVMNLLRSPEGHVTNLSTVPAPGGRKADDGHPVPLFPSASDPQGRQGFVRVINHSSRAGEVRITAFDDAGREYGPLTLTVAADAATHFNSHDVEAGNPDSGLAGQIGSVTGDLRLALASELDIEVLAYVRSRDGFLASMHDLVPFHRGSHRVPTFNPAANANQASLLRIVNPGTAPARVIVAGTDDRGLTPGGQVSLTLAAGASRTLTARDLEHGGDELDGALGDGFGKWRLVVESDEPLLVMSLLVSPTGHLTNLSTFPIAATQQLALMP